MPFGSSEHAKDYQEIIAGLETQIKAEAQLFKARLKTQQEQYENEIRDKEALIVDMVKEYEAKSRVANYCMNKLGGVLSPNQWKHLGQISKVK